MWRWTLRINLSSIMMTKEMCDTAVITIDALTSRTLPMDVCDDTFWKRLFCACRDKLDSEWAYTLFHAAKYAHLPICLDLFSGLISGCFCLEGYLPARSYTHSRVHGFGVIALLYHFFGCLCWAHSNSCSADRVQQWTEASWHKCWDTHKCCGTDRVIFWGWCITRLVYYKS